jgi:uracil-DNA glycosylase family 4
LGLDRSRLAVENSLSMSEHLDDEFLAVCASIEEQLKFYREIGIEDIGASASGTEMALGAGSEGALGRLLAEEQTANLPRQHQDKEATTQSASQGDQVGLFGDLITTGQREGSRAKSVSVPVLESRDSSLEEIREEIGDCTRCRLHEHRRTIVFGEGSPQAKLAFVGEGPGADEDATGRPFVGRAGQLLDKIIEAIGLRREDVYIANIVKCRPPGNRTPERDEVETCEPFLFRQLAFIRPEVIVALGSPAFQCLLRTREPTTRARGQWREWNGIKVMPTFHPAFLLRSPDKKREVWEDMKKVRDYLNAD